MKRKQAQPIFKPYTMAQPSLIPPSWEELIPAGHLVRVVNREVDKLDLEPLLKKYKGGGTSSYHPQMMLKVLVYAYTERIAFQVPQNAVAASVKFNIDGRISDYLQASLLPPRQRSIPMQAPSDSD